MSEPKVYLAGPEVFHPEAIDIGKAKQDVCAAYGLLGVFPLDQSPRPEPGEGVGHAIGRQNFEALHAADAVIANLTPFRGPSADVGTVVELVDAVTAGKVVAAYTNTTVLYADRVQPDGLEIESFGYFDNLMLPVLLERAGTRIITVDTAPGERFTDLTGFDEAVRDVADQLAARTNGQAASRSSVLLNQS